MEQQFFEDEFEQFLKETADQHRMYPSDGVWTSIYRRLHARRRRIALGAMLLLVLGGLLWLASTTPVARFEPKIAAVQPVSKAIDEYSVNHSSVTVEDIIEKLRAKSLIPPMTIDAPKALEPLRINKGYIARLSSVPNLLTLEVPVIITEEAVASKKQSSGITDLYFEPEQQINLAFSEVSGKINSTDKPFIDIGPIPVWAKLNLAPDKKESLNSLNTIRLQTPATKRWSVIMSFAPSIGYRNLSEDKLPVDYGNSPLMVSHLDVNQFVDHQPAIGFELGGSVRYQVSKVLSFRTGLQLNLTRYSIEAFTYSPEKATLSLNAGFGGTNDTLISTSSIRNLAGNRPERLQNQYLQIAVPIGAELKLFGDSKIQLNIAGSLQPSYLLNTNQYLLSSDFSNYVKEPSLIRRWNLASSMEAFVSYQRGDIRWQVGPQFRYNLLSTYKKEFPIKENLMEYGVKIGVSKTLR